MGDHDMHAFRVRHPLAMENEHPIPEIRHSTEPTTKFS